MSLKGLTLIFAVLVISRSDVLMAVKSVRVITVKERMKKKEGGGEMSEVYLTARTRLCQKIVG